MIEYNNVQENKNKLGQFFTPVEICKDIVDRFIDVNDSDCIIEPSFGSGNFLIELYNKFPSNDIIGIELDDELFNSFSKKYPDKLLYNINFYDFKYTKQNKVIFVGNPPYRTPAFSLKTHKKIVMDLFKSSNVSGIREESVIFLLMTIDIIKKNNIDGEIHYILPMSMFKNNSKFFTKFKQYLKDNCIFKSGFSIIGQKFDNVSQELVYIHLLVPNTNKCANNEFIFNDTKISVDEFLCLNDDSINFMQIFKKTYLGSVPCESLLMSVGDESVDHFKDRLVSIIENKNIDRDILSALLKYEGRYHLNILNSSKDKNAKDKKLDIILSYVKCIQKKDGILDEFRNIKNYKPITVRNGKTRFYFRCDELKYNTNFVYNLNPNPCRSFYFTGNPSHSSTDYFGFCEYDVNRNVSPGANRTVPIENIEENITEWFYSWWKSNTDEPITEIFNYIIYVSKTEWYKKQKKLRKRFYFSIPKKFIDRSERYADRE